MKKAMIMVLMALMTMGVYAQDIRLKSGDVAPIMQKDKTATLDLDFSKAKLADLSKKELSDKKFLENMKKNAPEDYAKWDKYKEECYEFFMERWNDAKGFCEVIEKGKADFVIHVKFDYIDTGNAGAAMWSWSAKGGGVIMRGTVVVTDAAGKKVCEFEVNDFQGRSVRAFDMKFPSFGRRMALFHKNLAKDITDIAKKAKK